MNVPDLTTVVVRRGGYTHFDNGVFHAGLSCRAIGLLVYMLSKPPTWRFSATRISRDVREGRDAILTAMTELRDAGFVHLRTVGGATPTRTYFVRDSLDVPWPSSAGVPGPENPDQENPEQADPSQAKSGDSVTPEEVTPEEVRTEPGLGRSAERPPAKRRFPDGWTPGDPEREMADEVGMDTAMRREQWDQFRDHHVSTGKSMVDWPAAWRTWCRNWKRFQRPAAARPAEDVEPVWITRAKAKLAAQTNGVTQT